MPGRHSQHARIGLDMPDVLGRAGVGTSKKVQATDMRAELYKGSSLTIWHFKGMGELYHPPVQDPHTIHAKCGASDWHA